MSTARPYNSPLRDAQAHATREAILNALYGLMGSGAGPDEIGMEAIAQGAGIQRRTIFRHFATKEDLLAAFWVWLNDRIGASPSPRGLPDILNGPREAFPRFDTHEAAMRAALHSPTGRDMRMATVAGRRALFAQALRPALATAAPEDARRVEALAHLLFSASAWEVLKDYGGLSGDEAGETASWALEVILSAVTPGQTVADATSPTQEKRDET
jgi:AcrR family transcriptional regulator